MKYSYLAAVAVAFATPVVAVPAVAQTLKYNADPSIPFTFGNGNNGTPAYAAVLTNGNLELATRFKQTGQPFSSSNASGVYSFALGTSNISFDYSAFGYSPVEGATVLLTNLLTGQTAGYNILAIPDANGLDRGYQGSQRLSFGFLNGNLPAAFGNLGFNANVDNTYRFDFSTGGNTLTTFAQVGAGAPAVPEPATWAMMILGFGAMGAMIRRHKTTTSARIRFA